MRVSKRTELEAAMGPLEGIRIVELAGIGPGPFCAMLLSDMGAEVIRVDRAAIVGQDTDRDGNDARYNLLSRGRRNIAVDLKNAAGVDAALRLIDRDGALASGAWKEERGANRPDGGAHYYHVYETRDGEHIAIGAIEPQFYALLLKHTGLEGEDLPPQIDRAYWPEMQERLTRIFKTRTRAEWVEIMQQTDICFAPVLRMSEALRHPHNVERGSFIEIEGIPQPAPAPRFLGTPTRVQRPPARVGEHTDQILKDWGFSAGENRRTAPRGRGRIRLAHCGRPALSGGCRSRPGASS